MYYAREWQDSPLEFCDQIENNSSYDPIVLLTHQ